MTTSELFKKNLRAYLDGYKLIINQGGQGSGKTFAIMQMLAYIALLSKNKLHIIVASYALPHLKSGAIKIFDSILESAGINIDYVKNKSEQRYFLGNSMIEFFGVEGKEGKAHSLRPDIIFINEANIRISWEVFKQFYSRAQKCTIIDFNPSREFWLNEHILGKEKNYMLIKSTYLENKFISKNEFEFIHDKRNKPGWENWYKVYGLGEFGQLEDSILDYEYGVMDNNASYVYGLDFGVRDKDALVKVAVDNDKKVIYARELLYESGNSTNELAQKLIEKVGKKDLIIADSAALRTIMDLKHIGLNIRGAVKERKSETIKKLKEYKIIISDDSYNLARELNGWTWLDKKAELPVDGNDHAIDAMIYGAMFLINNYRGKLKLLL